MRACVRVCVRTVCGGCCVIFPAVTTCLSTVFQSPRQIDLPECLQGWMSSVPRGEQAVFTDWFLLILLLLSIFLTRAVRSPRGQKQRNIRIVDQHESILPLWLFLFHWVFHTNWIETRRRKYELMQLTIDMETLSATSNPFNSNIAYKLLWIKRWNL